MPLRTDRVEGGRVKRKPKTARGGAGAGLAKATDRARTRTRRGTMTLLYTGHTVDALDSHGGVQRAGILAM